MTRTFDYIFSLRKPKNYKSEPVRIFLRITIAGKRCETATAQFADPDSWNAKTGRMNGKSDAAKSVNSYLDILQNKLYDCHAELLQSNVQITAESMRNKFNREDERARSFLGIFSAYHQNMVKLIGRDFVAITVNKFKAISDHLAAFIKWKYNISDISLNQLKYEFITDFESLLSG